MPHPKKAFLAILTRNEPFLPIIRSCTVVLTSVQPFISSCGPALFNRTQCQFYYDIYAIHFSVCFSPGSPLQLRDFHKICLNLPMQGRTNRIMILNDSGHTSLNPCQRGGAVLHQRSHTEFSGCSDSNEH